MSHLIQSVDLEQYSRINPKGKVVLIINPGRLTIENLTSFVIPVSYLMYIHFLDLSVISYFRSAHSFCFTGTKIMKSPHDDGHLASYLKRTFKALEFLSKSLGGCWASLATVRFLKPIHSYISSAAPSSTRFLTALHLTTKTSPLLISKYVSVPST